MVPRSGEEKPKFLGDQGEMGRTVGRKLSGSCRYAWKVGSVDAADFQGFRPVARLSMMIASDQMSLKRGE